MWEPRGLILCLRTANANKRVVGQEVTKHALECKLERARSGTITLETGMGTGGRKVLEKSQKKIEKSVDKSAYLW